MLYVKIRTKLMCIFVLILLFFCAFLFVDKFAINAYADQNDEQSISFSGTLSWEDDSGEVHPLFGNLVL